VQTQSIVELYLVIGLEADELSGQWLLLSLRLLTKTSFGSASDESCCHQTSLILPRESRLQPLSDNA